MPTQNWAGSNLNSAINHNIGKADNGNLYYLDGYLTEIQFIDGQALTPSSFGETDTLTGVWKPKKYAGTYGTNGFYLNFSDNSATTATTIGKDNSGNGNNWTPNNISITAGSTYDSMLDVPTPYVDGGNGRGNYAVMNPLSPTFTDSSSTYISQGNLLYTPSSDYSIVKSTMDFPVSGKYYLEITLGASGNVNVGQVIGIMRSPAQSYATNSYITYQCLSYGYGYDNAGNIVKGAASQTTITSTSAPTNNDVIAIAFDADNQTVKWYKNNTLLYTLNLSTAPDGYYGNDGGWVFATSAYGGAPTQAINFGQRPFSYTPPTGFVALNTQNLPTPTISNGANYMAASLWTGDASTPRAVVSNLAFSPDLVWTKDRSVGYQHSLQDTVRGTGASKKLYSSLTEAENGANSVYGHINSFDSNGFTVATGTGGAQHVNASGVTYVGWSWKAGGASSSNTAGSITSTVSAGATQGFSVVTYTGTGANATVGHGLGVAPKMIIVKNRTTATGWLVYHASVGNTGALILNGTNTTVTSVEYWNNTTPTSSVFTVGISNAGNQSTNNLVAYCFAEVAGYSKFGSYTGNGSTDGPFVYLGFRPRFILWKRTDSTSDWRIWDTSRSPYNAANLILYPNASDAEYTDANQNIDVVSNGFKLRTTTLNVNGGTYIFAAFAENPFKHSLAR
jgi:hypothetical protein